MPTPHKHISNSLLDILHRFLTYIIYIKNYIVHLGAHLNMVPGSRVVLNTALSRCIEVTNLLPLEYNYIYIYIYIYIIYRIVDIYIICTKYNIYMYIIRHIIKYMSYILYINSE